MHVRYLGWSAFEFRGEAHGPGILIDPFLSGSPEKNEPKSPVRVDELRNVSLVLVSHGASDHIGDTLEILKYNPDAILCCGSDVKSWAVKSGVKDERIALVAPGVEVAIGEIGLKVKAVMASHQSGVKVGDLFLSAAPLSYILNFAEGLVVFHAGDTAITLDLLLYGLLYRPQVALLGVGGATINRRKLVEMNPKEALMAAMLLGVKTVIPMHYSGMEGQELKQLVDSLSLDHKVCCVPQPGEWFELK